MTSSDASSTRPDSVSSPATARCGRVALEGSASTTAPQGGGVASPSNSSLSRPDSSPLAACARRSAKAVVRRSSDRAVGAVAARSKRRVAVRLMRAADSWHTRHGARVGHHSTASGMRANAGWPAARTCVCVCVMWESSENGGIRAGVGGRWAGVGVGCSGHLSCGGRHAKQHLGCQ